jgi:cell wall-associated NlpC family hydrolase
VLAGIGWVESRHAGGRAEPATGQVSPSIVGPAIDGREGFASIRDASSPDGWAHALGPMQFLSTTFTSWGVVAPDRPPGAVADPQNAWDAIYSAAAYLCARQPAIDDVDAAIRRYNHSDQYVDDVLAKAAEYGLGQGAAVGSELVAGSGEAVVAAAMTQLGVPYEWGGSTPGVGFDCSGLVQWAYAQIGISLPRTTGQQVSVGVAVAVDELRPGDLVFSRSIRRGGQVVDRGHVAIYVGGGQVVVAPSTGDVITMRTLDPRGIQAIRRVLT